MIEPTRPQLETLDMLATDHHSVRVAAAPVAHGVLLVACLTPSGREKCRYRILTDGLLVGLPTGSPDRHYSLETT